MYVVERCYLEITSVKIGHPRQMSPGAYRRVLGSVWLQEVLFHVLLIWLVIKNVTPRHHPYRTYDLRSGSQDHHPSKNSVQKTICCNSASNAPDDGRMYPKHVELRIHQ